MTKPLAIDLFCGLGGWTEGLLAEGYDVIGFDIERHVYGEDRYPAQLVIQDVRTLHGSQFKDAALIVASPPSNELFETCFRIQREACAAAGRHIPMVVENVAEKWVGRARWNFGSFYLWGDIPALMPIGSHIKVQAFRFDGSGRSFQSVSVRRTALGNGTRFTSRDCGVERWFNDSPRSPDSLASSSSPRRKFASAMIAKIPLPLARHIGAVFRN